MIFLYLVALLLVVLSLFVINRLLRMPLGRAWEALREDEIACRSLGLSPTRIKLTAFTISAAFAGFAGTLFAARQGFVSPESFTFAESAFVLAIVVLGGMGSQFAVILAAILLVVSRELMRDFNEYSMLMLGGLMVLMMIWRPQGSANDARAVEAEKRSGERRAGMSQPLLSVSGLMMRFGGLLAVNNVSLELREREIVSLIGPNGAGKTTVFNCLTGFYKPTGGIIMLRDQHLEGLPGQQIARMGVVRTFQHVRLFREMTVIENLLVAQHQQLKTGLFSGLLKTPAFRRAQSEALDRAATWLERIGLLEHANRQASNLAYGDQRRLEIARCMVTQPEILMLDEPAAGLNPKETKELDELIAELRNHHNTTILLIEHDMKLVMGISDRIYVVNQGTPLANGTPEEIRNNPDVIRAYLGEA